MARWWWQAVSMRVLASFAFPALALSTYTFTSRADAIGLRAPGLGPRVVNAFQIQIERVLVRFSVAAILVTVIGQDPQPVGGC